MKYLAVFSNESLNRFYYITSPVSVRQAINNINIAINNKDALQGKKEKNINAMVRSTTMIRLSHKTKPKDGCNWNNKEKRGGGHCIETQIVLMQ